MVVMFFLYVFWKILAVETNSQKKLKRHMVFLLFCISFIQVLCFLVFFLVWLRCKVLAGPGCENELRKKKVKRNMVPSFLLYLIQV